MKPLSKTLLATVAATATVALMSVPAWSAETLKVQSSYNPGDFAYKHLTGKWAPKLTKMTDGALEINILPIGSVVPYKETPRAVSLGVLDGDMTPSTYFSGSNAAFAILGDLIAGYDTPTQGLGFCREGGGEQALQRALDSAYGDKIQVVGCGPYTREALVATVPIRGVDDLEGVKIRSPEGLAADVFRRAGATPASIPYSEVYNALQQGVVEAADASAYVNNDAVGLHQIAPYPIYPGIHSQPHMQFTMNQELWNSLAEPQQKALREWFYAAQNDLRKVANERDQELVKRDKKSDEITVINWPQEERDKFRQIARNAWEAFAERSPEARAALDAHLEYMRRIGLVKE